LNTGSRAQPQRALPGALRKAVEIGASEPPWTGALDWPLEKQ
jgi:hypothetical protein